MRGFGQVDGNYWTRPVHNVLFQALTELGVAGALVLLAIFFVLTVETVRLYRVPGARKNALFCALVLVGASILGQSEPNLDQSNLWLSLALVQAAASIHAGQRRVPIIPVPSIPSARG